MSDYLYSGSAQNEVYYKFTCEHCGKEVSRKYLIETAVNNCDSEFSLETSLKQTQEGKIESFKESVENGNYPFEDECPYCHKHQSWKVKNSKIYPVIGLIVGLILGFIVTIIFGIWHYWFIAPLAGLFIGLVIGLASYLKIKKETANVTEKQKPTYTIL